MLAASAGSSAGSAIGTVLIVIVLFAFYWLPSIIAAVRKVHGIGQVIVVNLFLGWTFIGWVVALVMSFRAVPPTAAEARLS
jgi:Superinfection immunity protein